MFFFFKQKTAYEMRISDWSSDVCSSDLAVAHAALAALALVEHRVAELVADVFQRRVAVVADDRGHRLERGVQPAVGALGRVRVGLQEFAVGIDLARETERQFADRAALAEVLAGPLLLGSGIIRLGDGGHWVVTLWG